MGKGSLSPLSSFPNFLLKLFNSGIYLPRFTYENMASDSGRMPGGRPARYSGRRVGGALRCRPLVNKLQSTYAAMTSFRAAFTQELTHQESATTETRHGTLLFRKPLLVRWETDKPNPELLLVTDKDIWNWLPDEELAYRYSLELARDSLPIIMVVTGQSPLNRDFEVERMVPEASDGNLVHLLLYPKEPTAQLTEAQVWIDPATSLIRRAQVMDFYGNTNLIRFDSLTPDAALQDSDFTFTPPAGTEVEDHTDGSHPSMTPLMH